MMRNFDRATVVSAVSFFRRDRRGKRHGKLLRVAAGINHHARGLLCALLVISLLANSTPAASQTIVGVATEWHTSLALWARANGVAETLQRALSGQSSQPRPQEKQEERNIKVSLLKIFPGDTTIGVGGRVSFAAVGYDANKASIGGVEIKWSAQDGNGKPATDLFQSSTFESNAPGTFTITAEGAGQTAQATVTVLAAPGRPLAGEVPGRTRRVSTRDLPAAIGPETPPAEDKTPAEAEPTPGNGSKIATSPARENLRKRTEIASARRLHQLRAHALPLDIDQGWGDGNYWSADDPGNGRGNPPGHPIDGGAGSS
ncbi:MAG TPA: hypothetical protein VGN90_13420, partial [Pyrinomonadaceae bacterium]|nr:hypothetical protein [Pyrinomonadaceae bacterium]